MDEPSASAATVVATAAPHQSEMPTDDTLVAVAGSKNNNGPHKDGRRRLWRRSLCPTLSERPGGSGTPTRRPGLIESRRVSRDGAKTLLSRRISLTGSEPGARPMEAGEITDAAPESCDNCAAVADDDDDDESVGRGRGARRIAAAADAADAADATAPNEDADADCNHLIRGAKLARLSTSARARGKCTDMSGGGSSSIKERNRSKIAAMKLIFFGLIAYEILLLLLSSREIMMEHCAMSTARTNTNTNMCLADCNSSNNNNNNNVARTSHDQGCATAHLAATMKMATTTTTTSRRSNSIVRLAAASEIEAAEADSSNGKNNSNTMQDDDDDASKKSIAAKQQLANLSAADATTGDDNNSAAAAMQPQLLADGHNDASQQQQQQQVVATRAVQASRLTSTGNGNNLNLGLLNNNGDGNSSLAPQTTIVVPVFCNGLGECVALDVAGAGAAAQDAPAATVAPNLNQTTTQSSSLIASFLDRFRQTTPSSGNQESAKQAQVTAPTRNGSDSLSAGTLPFQQQQQRLRNSFIFQQLNKQKPAAHLLTPAHLINHPSQFDMLAAAPSSGGGGGVAGMNTPSELIKQHQQIIMRPLNSHKQQLPTANQHEESSIDSNEVEERTQQPHRLIALREFRFNESQASKFQAAANDNNSSLIALADQLVDLLQSVQCNNVQSLVLRNLSIEFERWSELYALLSIPMRTHLYQLDLSYNSLVKLGVTFTGYIEHQLVAHQGHWPFDLASLGSGNGNSSVDAGGSPVASASTSTAATTAPQVGTGGRLQGQLVRHPLLGNGSLYKLVLSKIDAMRTNSAFNQCQSEANNNSTGNGGGNWLSMYALIGGAPQHQANSMLLNASLHRAALIRSLDISNNKLKWLLNDQFRALKHLQTIRLDHNKIRYIHQQAFNGLESLRFLNLNYNRLQVIYVEQFQNNYNLLALSLRNNYLAYLRGGSFASQTNLKRLDLSQNKFTILSNNAFVGLESMRYLNLSSNQFIHVPSNSFHPLISVRQLDLSYNQITQLTPGTFFHLPIEELWLDHNSQLVAIDRGAFWDLQNLKQLWLNSNSMLMSVNSQAFVGTPNIHVINIDDCRLLDAQAKQMLENITIAMTSRKLLLQQQQQQQQQSNSISQSAQQQVHGSLDPVDASSNNTNQSTTISEAPVAMFSLNNSAALAADVFFSNNNHFHQRALSPSEKATTTGTGAGAPAGQRAIAWPSTRYVYAVSSLVLVVIALKLVLDYTKTSNYLLSSTRRRRQRRRVYGFNGDADGEADTSLSSSGGVGGDRADGKHGGDDYLFSGSGRCSSFESALDGSGLGLGRCQDDAMTLDSDAADEQRMLRRSRLSLSICLNNDRDAQDDIGYTIASAAAMGARRRCGGRRASFNQQLGRLRKQHLQRLSLRRLASAGSHWSLSHSSDAVYEMSEHQPDSNFVARLAPACKQPHPYDHNNINNDNQEQTTYGGQQQQASEQPLELDSNTLATIAAMAAHQSNQQSNHQSSSCVDQSCAHLSSDTDAQAVAAAAAAACAISAITSVICCPAMSQEQHQQQEPSGQDQVPDQEHLYDPAVTLDDVGSVCLCPNCTTTSAAGDDCYETSGEQGSPQEHPRDANAAPDRSASERAEHSQQTERLANNDEGNGNGTGNGRNNDNGNVEQLIHSQLMAAGFDLGHANCAHFYQSLGPALQFADITANLDQCYY